MAKKSEVLDIKRLRLMDGDVLIIREVEEDMVARSEIVKSLDRTLKAKRVTICFVNKLSDVRAISEEQMNRIGWFRKDDD
jgi:hypothetical protein